MKKLFDNENEYTVLDDFDDFDGFDDFDEVSDLPDGVVLADEDDLYHETDDDAIMAFLERRRAQKASEGVRDFDLGQGDAGENPSLGDESKDAVDLTAGEDKNRFISFFSANKETFAKIGKITGRVFIYIGTFLGIVIITLLIAIGIICKGPSSMVRDMFVSNMVQTGQMDFLAYIFLSEEEVDKIVKANEPVASSEKTDTSLIHVGGKPSGDDVQNGDSNDNEFDMDYLEIIDIKGKTYKGKMLIVNDPSRVTVGTAAAYGENCVGYTTLYMAQSSNSIAAINGGGYVDKASNKTGGIPMGRDESGIVIANGELKYGNLETTYEIIGLDKNGVLHVDNMKAKDALEKGIRDAVNWGPILVKNGEPCVIASDGANLGFHPRSAIGQREDGAILLLVIDGRQSNSLGASYADLIEIMVNYGAVNAANLDGGMSSYMVYENRIITEPYLLYDPRNVATSWLVSRVEGE